MSSSIIYATQKTTVWGPGPPCIGNVWDHWHGAELARWVATSNVLAAAGSLRIINQGITLPTPTIVPEPIIEPHSKNACLHHLILVKLSELYPRFSV